MANVDEVKAGLLEGRAYERVVDETGGKELVLPYDETLFVHIVLGVNEDVVRDEDGSYLSHDLLESGHWHKEVWNRCPARDREVVRWR